MFQGIKELKGRGNSRVPLTMPLLDLQVTLLDFPPSAKNRWTVTGRINRTVSKGKWERTEIPDFLYSVTALWALGQVLPHSLHGTAVSGLKSLTCNFLLHPCLIVGVPRDSNMKLHLALGDSWSIFSIYFFFALSPPLPPLLPFLLLFRMDENNIPCTSASLRSWLVGGVLALHAWPGMNCNTA